MAMICRALRNVRKELVLQPSRRSLTHESVVRDVKIVERKEGNDLVIEGMKIDASKDSLVMRNESNACVLCALDVDLKHTDVLILKQFLRPDGCLLPARITGLCNTQQRRVSYMVAMAQKAGLMPNIVPGNRIAEPSKRRDFKKFNTYYDETTIPYRLRR